MFQEALESRLKVIEEEITRLIMLSSERAEPNEQDNYLGLAQDLEHEARQLRAEIKKQSERQPAASHDSLPKNSFFVLAG